MATLAHLVNLYRYHAKLVYFVPSLLTESFSTTGMLVFALRTGMLVFALEVEV